MRSRGTRQSVFGVVAERRGAIKRKATVRVVPRTGSRRRSDLSVLVEPVWGVGRRRIRHIRQGVYAVREGARYDLVCWVVRERQCLVMRHGHHVQGVRQRLQPRHGIVAVRRSGYTTATRKRISSSLIIVG